MTAEITIPQNKEQPSDTGIWRVASWLPGRARLWVSLAFAYYVLFGSWTLFQWGFNQYESLIYSIGFLPLGFFAVGCLIYSSSRPNIEKQTRLGWVLITLGFISLEIGEILYILMDLSANGVRFPDIPDIPYLLGYLVIFFGLIAIPTQLRDPSQNKTWVFDLLVAVFGAGAVIWYFIIAPTVLASGNDGLAQFVAGAYPIMDILIITSITRILFRKSERNTRNAISILGFGLLVYLAGDLLYAWFNLLGTYEENLWIDITFTTSYCIVGLAALRQAHPYLPTADREENNKLNWLAISMPFFTLTASVLLAAYGILSKKGSGLPLNGLIIGAAITIILITLRQVITIRENNRLVRELSLNSAQLQESINETQRLLKESKTLAEVGREISSSLDTQNVLENVTQYAKTLLDAELSALFLPENGGTTFRATTAIGADADEVKNDVIQSGEGLLGFMMHSRRGEYVNDTANDTRTIVVPGTEALPNEHLMGVPLLDNDKVIGIIAVWRSGIGKYFTQADLNFLTNLSRQTSLAIKNSQLYAEAEESRKVAEQANQMKSSFLANMSHELRTPLNAIINFTELVSLEMMGPVNEEQKEALGYSLSSSKHLLQLINDVLDISKIQAGKLNLFVENNVNLNNEINEVVGMVQPILSKQFELYSFTVRLIQDVDEDLPLLACDRRRIKQIFLNLLTNAIKFTEKGTITLSVKKNKNEILVGVLDTGQGIAPEQHVQIFESFMQTPDGVKRADGTGLGLPITKSLVEAHGGKIWLESDIGQGSSFFFTIPYNES
jgi:signal transduction histidine kinase